MRSFSRYAIIVALLLIPGAAWAGFTETLPRNTFSFDVGFYMSTLNSMWDNNGDQVPLIEEMVRYEPGAGKQGILKPQAQADLGILVLQLFYGITDSVSVGFGVPIVAYTRVDPNFEWERGDYQWNLGRSYSESDFWQWAGSMGQPKPEEWSGNEWVLSDIQLGGIYRFTDHINWFQQYDLAMSGMILGALPTGTPPDPEEVITAGTTTWDLHANGELCFHLSMDKFFKKSLDNRLVLGVDVFHEFLFKHTYISPEGTKNPLMLNYRPYTGKHYTIDGGDFTGFSFQTDVVPYRGPALQTWLTANNPAMADSLPPILNLSFRYTYTHLMQTDWESDSEIWDWDREKLWRPGYKNILYGKATLSLLRLGLPMQPYVAYRNLTWIPGKNSRAPNVMMFGSRFLLKFW